MNEFSHGFLARMRKLRITTNSKSIGIHRGNRRSNKFGSSLEFSDFREYEPGDDVRQIDWNVYGRTQKHFIKRYLDEQEMKVAIYLDCTSSMRSLPSKWTLAKQIAAALSYIALVSEDRLSFIPVSATNVRGVDRKGSVHTKLTLFEIMKINVEQVTDSFSKEMMRKIQKSKQMSIIITDGLEPIAEYRQLLRRLASLKSDILLIQVLGNSEVEPNYFGDAKLIDSETDQEINVSMSPKLITEYQSRLENHNKELIKACTKLGIHYLFVKDDKSIEEIILKDFVSQRLLSY